MELLVEYSGAVAVFTTWVLVITPTFIVDLDRDTDPGSVVGKHPKWGRIFNFGLALTGMLLIVYVLKLRGDFHSLPNGLILFFLGSISLSFVGIINMSISEKAHNIATAIWIVFHSVGIFMVGAEFLHSLPVVGIISLIVAFAIVIALVYFYIYRQQTIYFEYILTTAISIWTVHFYFI